MWLEVCIRAWPGWLLLFFQDVDSISNHSFIFTQILFKITKKTPSPFEFLQNQLVLLPVFPLKVLTKLQSLMKWQKVVFLKNIWS